MAHPSLTRFLSIFVALGIPALQASESSDLKRTKPVPETEPIPIIDFFRPSLINRPKLSPQGTHIAALITHGADQYQLLSYDIATGKSEVLGGGPDRDIYEFTWLNDKRLFFSLSSEKLYGMGVFAVDVGRFDDPRPLLQYCGARLVSVPRNSRTTPLVWASAELEEGQQRDGGVLELDSSAYTGKMVNLLAADVTSADFIAARESNRKHVRSRINPPDQGIDGGYMADKDGHLEYAFTAEKGLYFMYRLDGDKWTRCPVDLEDLSVLASGEKPGDVVVLGKTDGKQPRPVQFMKAATGELGMVLLQDKGYDFHGWLYREPTTGNIVGAVYHQEGPHVEWFTEDYKRLQKTLDAFFPGLVVRILDQDETGKIFLVSTFSDRQPAIYNWVNLETHTVGLIESSNPWIDPKRMQPMNVMKFKTRDGKKLDAYLTLPAGATKENPPPLIVLPHGGPWVRDTWGFDSEVQFLASRGYAVLQPNYRGSTGYSWMFPYEDDWAFRKMHDDVTDATKAAIKTGRVDPNRIAIMGSSFGGYLAVSGVVNEPSLYRCAVTIAGVFDWAATIKEAKYDQYEDAEYSRLLRRLGDPAKEKEKFDAISPVRHIDQVRVPVFVAHGKEDRVVAVSESRRLISELEKYKVPHETLIVSGEGHGMHHLRNNLRLYESVEKFLAQNLAGAAATTPDKGNPISTTP